jgi:hypothetical protein
MVYDAQGRQSESTDHEGRVSKRYFSRLLDRRLLSLSYPDYEGSPEKFYGPASLSLVNLAGQGEASGSVAISGGSTTTAVTGHIDETQADLIAAVDLGTLASLSTQTYAASGYTLENSRAYFLIPTSLPGTDGTHYDQTSFAYDTLGRRVRTLAPHGTISRVTFDGIGRQIESWVGTNDFGEVGGSSSGTNNDPPVADRLRRGRGRWEQPGDADDRLQGQQHGRFNQLRLRRARAGALDHEPHGAAPARRL